MEEIFNKKQTERLNKLKNHLFNIEKNRLYLEINKTEKKNYKYNNSKSLTISLRIPLKLYNRILKNAEKNKKTKSSYLRLLIKRGLKNE